MPATDTTKILNDSIAAISHGATSDAIPMAPHIELSQTATENSYRIAQLLMNLTDFLLNLVGLQHHETIRTALYASLIILLSIAIGAVVKWILLQIVNRISRRFNSIVMDNLRRAFFFTKISRLLPPIVFLILIQISLQDSVRLADILSECGYIYMIIVIANALCAFVSAMYELINTTRNKKNLPLKGIRQLVVGIIWIIATIIIVAILVGKSPSALLAGLGAFAAVLMLVFKDSILGVVAGVQLSENDTLRVGDWIEVAGTSANGIVQEVSLVSVKILNWDKTITTLPPYSLVSGSFKNYRSMQLSNTRRISRCYNIDCDTVRFVTPDMLDSYRQIPYMSDYIDAKLRQKSEGKIENYNNSEGLANGTIDTNLGLFRAYLVMYLRNNPSIDQHSFLFVNTLAQTAYGIPLQIYCFTNTSDWVSYEAIQSEIFEHLAAVMPLFGLYAYEQASGRDTVNEGYLEAGKSAADLYGLPYPFLHPGVDKGLVDTPVPPQK